MAEKIVEARESFAVYLKDGTPFSVATGDRFLDSDPVVTSRRHLFGEITVRSSLPRDVTPSAGGDVETTSAAPGARRPLSRKVQTDA